MQRHIAADILNDCFLIGDLYFLVMWKRGLLNALYASFSASSFWTQWPSYDAVHYSHNLAVRSAAYCEPHDFKYSGPWA